MRRGPVMAVLVSAGLLGAAAMSSRVAIDDAAVDAYHTSVREAAERFPLDSGQWVGRDVPLPPSATKLLQPNAIVARRYQSLEREDLSATLLVVQCADIRDMQGHYPPNCYPAHGWGRGEVSEGARIGDLPALRYEFVRRADGGQAGITVYNMFILPTGEVTTQMKDVRRASSDYEMRPYGAAQIQVLFDRSVPESDHPRVLEEMRRIADPVVSVLRDGASAVREGASR